MAREEQKSQISLPSGLARVRATRRYRNSSETVEFELPSTGQPGPVGPRRCPSPSYNSAQTWRKWTQRCERTRERCEGPVSERRAVGGSAKMRRMRKGRDRLTLTAEPRAVRGIIRIWLCRHQGEEGQRHSRRPKHPGDSCSTGGRSGGNQLVSGNRDTLIKENPLTWNRYAFTRLAFRPNSFPLHHLIFIQSHLSCLQLCKTHLMCT